MDIGERLRRLDDRWFPDYGRGRYDAPRPWWLEWGGSLAIQLPVFVAFLIGHELGGNEGIAVGFVVVLPIVLAAVVFLVMARRRWEATHRLTDQNTR